MIKKKTGIQTSFALYLQIQLEQSLKEYWAAEWPAANYVISLKLRLYPLWDHIFSTCISSQQFPPHLPLPQ